MADPSTQHPVSATARTSARSSSWAGTSADLGEDDLVVGEGVALDVPAASFGPRVLAALVDVAITIALLLGLLITLFQVTGGTSATATIVAITSTVTALVVWPVAWESLTRGRTPGKWAFGLRTVRTDGGPISGGHALMRSLLAVVEIWMLSAVPALISALVTGRGQRVGDLVAGTYVVRERAHLEPRVPTRMPPELAQWARSADIAPLPRGLSVALRRVLAADAQLTPQSRERLVRDLAGRLTPLVSPPPPRGTHPMAFLAAVAAERRRRDERRLQRDAALRARLAARLPHP